MRYALGVFLGALFPGIIFLGAAFIRLAGINETDPLILRSLWNLFTIWFLVCVAMLVVPVIVVRFARRNMLREWVLFEAGGLALFTPMWFLLAAELTGTPMIQVLQLGVEAALPILGEEWRVVGMNIGPVVLVPVLILSVLVGAFLLRPSFIARSGTVGEPAEPKAPKGEAAPPPAPVEKPEAAEPSIESEMPGVTRPVADERTVEELRTFLGEMSVPAATIEAIVKGGIETVTDLVATSAEQLVRLTGIDRRTAEDLHLSVQKKVWFGGI